MLVEDIIYGAFVVEPVLEELILCEEMQRLKEIHMVGSSYLIKPDWNETRFEHSLGTMLLVRRLGGSLPEQIAALLHDVSHTIFSHDIDLVMKKHSDDYHEEIKASYLAQSALPALLARYDYDYRELLLDDQQWTILEQAAPALCADRIDYTLRAVNRYFETPLPEIHAFMESLRVKEGRLVLNSLVTAEWFMREYYRLVIDFFYDPVNVYASEKMSDLLSYVLAANYLTADDLMGRESEVLPYLEELNDPSLCHLWRQFYAPVELIPVSGNEDYDLHHQKKLRLIDPFVLQDGELKLATELSSVARQINQQARRQSDLGLYLQIKPATAGTEE